MTTHDLTAQDAGLADERFERAFEDAPVGMVLVRVGRVERVNAAAAAMFGRDPAELVDCDPRILVHPDEVPLTEAAHCALRDGLTPPPQDRRIIRPDGKVLYTRLRYSLLHGPEAPAGLLSLILITDRTAEVEADRARTAALALFSTAVDQAPIGMCLIGLDGRFLRVNAALCRLFGRSQPDLLSKNFQELTHPHDLDADLALTRQCLDGTRDNYEIPKRYLRPDGEVIHALLSVSLIRSANGDPDHFVSQVMDLTQLHAAQEQLQIMEDRDRIARALHDSSIQKLFAAGLTLQALTTALPPGPAQRVEAVISELDSIIRGIRSVIYGLRAAGTGAGTGVRDRVVSVIEEVTLELGHHPQVRLEGPLEVALADDLVADLLLAVRRSLGDVAKRAHATRTEVNLTIDPTYSWVQLDVVDDGADPSASDPSDGLAELSRIAERRGGRCDVEFPVADSRAGWGTRLRWRVPIA